MFFSIRMLAENAKRGLAKRARGRVFACFDGVWRLFGYMSSSSVTVVNDQ